MSPDQDIAARGIEHLHKVLMVTGSFLLATGILVVIWAAASSKLISRLVVLPIDLTSRRFSLFLLWSSSITGLIIVGLWLFQGIPGMDHLRGEDGPLEMATAILFMDSGVLLFVAAVFHRRQSADHRKGVASLLVGIAIVFLFFGLEEISWGQRLFGWSTPAVLEQINDQGELNVHNLSNSLLRRLYQWGMAAFALLTAAGWLWLSRFKESTLRFLIPHGATAGLLFLMLLLGTFLREGEPLEELGAVFAFFYALTAIRASRPRHPAT